MAKNTTTQTNPATQTNATNTAPTPKKRGKLIKIIGLLLIVGTIGSFFATYAFTQVAQWHQPTTQGVVTDVNVEKNIVYIDGSAYTPCAVDLTATPDLIGKSIRYEKGWEQDSWFFFAEGEKTPLQVKWVKAGEASVHRLYPQQDWVSELEAAAEEYSAAESAESTESAESVDDSAEEQKEEASF